MKNSGFFELNRLPGNTALGYVEDDNGWRTNIYNLPIVGGGDGGAFTTVGDLYTLWDAFLKYKILINPNIGFSYFFFIRSRPPVTKFTGSTPGYNSVAERHKE